MSLLFLVKKGARKTQSINTFESWSSVNKSESECRFQRPMNQGEILTFIINSGEIDENIILKI